MQKGIRSDARLENFKIIDSTLWFVAKTNLAAQERNDKRGVGREL